MKHTILFPTSKYGSQLMFETRFCALNLILSQGIKEDQARLKKKEKYEKEVGFFEQNIIQISSTLT